MAAAAPATPAVAPAPMAVILDYWQQARLRSLDLAKTQYKSFFRLRAQEFIRGKGTLAVVAEAVCMGCTHCFDNCAFEAIDMLERRFSLPEYEYTSRKAVIIDENCVGCEKCAIVCPVDAITMVTAEGFEVKEGRVAAIPGAKVPEFMPFYQPPKPGKPRPPAEAGPFEKRETPKAAAAARAAASPPKPATPPGTAPPKPATVQGPGPPAPSPPKTPEPMKPEPELTPEELPKPPEKKKTAEEAK